MGKTRQQSMSSSHTWPSLIIGVVDLSERVFVCSYIKRNASAQTISTSPLSIPCAVRSSSAYQIEHKIPVKIVDPFC